MDLYADLVFEIEGEAIPVHRAVLAARSRLFRKALRRQWRCKVPCWTASCCLCSTQAAAGGRRRLLLYSLRSIAGLSAAWLGAAWHVWQPMHPVHHQCAQGYIWQCDTCICSATSRQTSPCHALLQPRTRHRPAAAPAGWSMQSCLPGD